MILALDASTTRGSVALTHNQQIFREVFIEVPRGRGGALFSALQKILHEAAEIDRVIVGVGPGSYNGIRAAIAVAWGIASSREIPLAGISSLLGLDEGSYCAVGDARRGQYYFARVSEGKFQREPELFLKDDLVVALQQTPELPIYSPAPIEFLHGTMIRTPSAARLALLAANLEPNFPQPLYLKAAYTTTPKKTPGNF